MSGDDCCLLLKWWAEILHLTLLPWLSAWTLMIPHSGKLTALYSLLFHMICWNAQVSHVNSSIQRNFDSFYHRYIHRLINVVFKQIWFRCWPSKCWQHCSLTTQNAEILKQKLSKKDFESNLKFQNRLFLIIKGLKSEQEREVPQYILRPLTPKEYWILEWITFESIQERKWTKK